MDAVATSNATAQFTFRVTEATVVHAVLRCDITFSVSEGGPGAGKWQVTAVVDAPTPPVCGAVGQTQGPWTISAGYIDVLTP